MCKIICESKAADNAQTKSRSTEFGKDIIFVKPKHTRKADELCKLLVWNFFKLSFFIDVHFLVCNQNKQPALKVLLFIPIYNFLLMRVHFPYQLSSFKFNFMKLPKKWLLLKIQLIFGQCIARAYIRGTVCVCVCVCRKILQKICQGCPTRR